MSCSEVNRSGISIRIDPSALVGRDQSNRWVLKATLTIDLYLPSTHYHHYDITVTIDLVLGRATLTAHRLLRSIGDAYGALFDSGNRTFFYDFRIRRRCDQICPKNIRFGNTSRCVRSLLTIP